MVRLDAGTSSLIRFKDCVFYCFSTNWAAGITDVFDVNVVTTFYVLLQDCVAIGGTGAGISWADTATHIYLANGAAEANNGGIVIAATS